jgi:hypothetical protein
MGRRRLAIGGYLGMAVFMLVSAAATFGNTGRRQHLLAHAVRMDGLLDGGGSLGQAYWACRCCTYEW